MRKKNWIVVGLLPVAALAAWAGLHARPTPPPLPPAPPVASAAPPPVAEPKMDPTDDSHDDERSYVFRIPSGEPTALSCEEARTIIEQVRAGLAYAPEGVQATAFATSAADWLDPHGLLSLAKDAPTSRAIARAAPDLIADLEGRRRRSCESALVPGGILESWSSELREAFDRGRRAPGGADPKIAVLEPLPPTGMAREVAAEIGRRVGAFEATYGPAAKPFADEARRRFFPDLDKAGWA